MRSESFFFYHNIYFLQDFALDRDNTSLVLPSCPKAFCNSLWLAKTIFDCSIGRFHAKGRANSAGTQGATHQIGFAALYILILDGASSTTSVSSAVSSNISSVCFLQMPMFSITTISTSVAFSHFVRPWISCRKVLSSFVRYAGQPSESSRSNGQAMLLCEYPKPRRAL